MRHLTYAQKDTAVLSMRFFTCVQKDTALLHEILRAKALRMTVLSYS